jgi:ATP-binding protein involved in chromosome partitioning
MYEEKKRTSHVIAIAAGKGGVGKSTVTVNLGLALQRKGYAVGIMDVDIYGPSTRKMLPESRLPQQKEGIIIPAESNGIKIISMAYFKKENEAAAVRAPIANQIVHQFIKNVEWGPLDFLLIDFPPGTGDIQLTLSQQANLTGAIMVTTPQEVALLDVSKAMHLFDQVKVPLIGVVENMSYFRHPTSHEIFHLFGKGGGEKLAQKSGIPFLGHIPIDPEISRCGDAGESLLGHQTEGAKAFEALANALELRIATLHSHHLSIRKLWQKERSSFTIEWNDGVVSDYKLSELQKHCPCAGCVDEITGKRISNSCHEDVQTSQIANVGRYALRIQFTSGCSNGIYDFTMLRNFAHA